MSMPKKITRPTKNLKPILHIYCEGTKTEPNYLNGYLDTFFPTNRRLLKVIKIEPTEKNTPVQLVSVAMKAQKEFPDGDVFWVVYDRESEQKYADKFHATAYDRAESKGIFVALSNVCFEVWLLLHFQDVTAQYNNYDDLRSSSALRTKCKERKMLDYDKGDMSIFSIFTKGDIELARRRAKKMNALTEQSANASQTKPYQWNPYTDIYKLLDFIDNFAAENLN
ncbi:hypothetical protein BCS42_08185 [Crenothrix sp. D3]|nr:hypothetical protein BCS42_08185 [Crenothrix sp. D3]